jgi:hypothetical protein
LGEFWEFFCSVNSTHFAIFFWNGTPNFQYQKIEKKNQTPWSGVHMYTLGKNEEAKV